MKTTPFVVLCSFFAVGCGGEPPLATDAGVVNRPDSAEDDYCRGMLQDSIGVDTTTFIRRGDGGAPTCTYTCRDGWVTCIAPCDAQPWRGLGGCGACGVVCQGRTSCQRDTPDTRVSPLYCRPLGMCSGRGSCTTPSPRTCTDYTGAAWCAPGTGSQTCTAAGMGATFSTSACTMTNRVGSCFVNIGQSSEVVLRFYPPITTLAAQAACGQPGSRFVAN